MKKLFLFNGILMQIVLIAFLTNVSIASGQDERKQQYPIPENINKVFQTCCMRCHGISGGRYPRSRLNFARWTEYGVVKQAEKVSLICSTLRKGKMPPKSARDSKPELIPTKEQVDLICRWSESIKSKKEKK